MLSAVHRIPNTEHPIPNTEHRTVPPPPDAPPARAGEVPSFKLVETDASYSFLDINPLAKGHALVVPKCASLPLSAGRPAADLAPACTPPGPTLTLALTLTLTLTLNPTPALTPARSHRTMPVARCRPRGEAA